MILPCSGFRLLFFGYPPFSIRHVSRLLYCYDTRYLKYVVLIPPCGFAQVIVVGNLDPCYVGIELYKRCI